MKFITKHFVVVFCNTRVQNLRGPISERPSPIAFNGVRFDLGKTIDACTAYITTDINGYPDV